MDAVTAGYKDLERQAQQLVAAGDPDAVAEWVDGIAATAVELMTGIEAEPLSRLNARLSRLAHNLGPGELAGETAALLRMLMGSIDRRLGELDQRNDILRRNAEDATARTL